MKEGTILFCSTEDVFEEELDKYPVRLQITRYTKRGILTGFTHVNHLAPSESLLNQTNHKWKKLKYTEEERLLMKQGPTGTWWDLYVVRFEQEMQERLDFQAAYARLKELLDADTNIVCVCYCDNLHRCHRSLIAKRLQQEGYTVILK